MADFIRAPKGTKDVIPAESYKWQYVERILRETAAEFGYSEIRFPVFEHTELFIRGVGDTTDVVQKEMYTFEDKGGRSITLRPEGTASTVRAFLENSLYGDALPMKAFYIVPNFRYEKPQAGRFRQHHQFGVECFGAKGPVADAEVISLADTYLKKFGITNITAHINSIGCPTCRPTYHAALTEFLAARKDKLCATCQERLEKNPMRVLDCKSPVCQELTQGAPVSVDYLCQECDTHFTAVQDYLKDMKIDFVLDTGIVRGLDYYTKTVFEFVSNDIGAQGTVCGGGRYDGLIEALGGASLPGLGFGSGLERLIMVMEALGLSFGEKPVTMLYVAPLGDQADKVVNNLTYELRKHHVTAIRDLSGRSLKAQLKYADKQGVLYTLVVGDGEIESGKAVLRDMKTGETREVALDSAEIAALILK